MKIKEFAYVCYAVTDLKRARDFYEQVLGLKVAKEWLNGTGGFIEYDCGPDILAIGAGAPGFNPGPNGATVALELEDFDESVATLKGANVKFLVEPMETPVCHMAIFSDPDGNNLMIHRIKVK